jgi:TolB-like protein/AraC-like DNA-binding protein/Tfp pilus assembly protein PilF
MYLLENSFLDKINQLIDKNTENPAYSIDEICRDLGISRSQLFRHIKDKTGLSPSLYIRQKRIHKGKELLDNTHLKIVEIAYRVGIDSPQSFSKYFTDEFGVSPSEYRKPREKGQADLIAPPPISETLTNTFPNVHQLPTFKINHWRFGLGAVLLIWVSIFVWEQVNESTLPSDKILYPVPTENSIAVLPFKNLGAAETLFFSDGIMEQIHNSIALIDNLIVISKRSSMRYRDTKKTIPQIAKELNVNYILGGTVLQVGNKIRINAELIKANEDRVVWANNYEGELSTVFSYMSTVAKEIAAELNQELSTAQSKKIDRAPTANLEAYNEYLKGKQLQLTRAKAGLEASIQRFDNAYALDPTFADAYSYKASSYYLLGSLDYMDLQKSYQMAEKYALTAIRLEEGNGMAYAILANVYRSQNKWEQSLSTYRVALKHSPNDAQINYWYSLALRSAGRLNEAIQYSTKAVALDPLYPVVLVGHIGNCSYAGRFDLAEKSIRDGAILFRDSYLYYYATAFYFINKHDYRSALEEFKKSDRFNSDVKSIKTFIVYTQLKLGQKELAGPYLRSMTNSPENYPYFAIIYAGLNDKVHCLKYLEKGAAVGILPEYLKVSPLFTFLHSESRFKAILQKIGLADSPSLTQ